MEENKKWFCVDIEGFPKESGTYLCIVRGATSLRLMKYFKEKDGWMGVGIGGTISKNVTHWVNIPSPPPALYMNILLKKSQTESLDYNEKIELADLLKHSAREG